MHSGVCTKIGYRTTEIFFEIPSFLSSQQGHLGPDHVLTWLLNIIVWIRAAKSAGTYFPEHQEFEPKYLA